MLIRLIAQILTLICLPSQFSLRMLQFLRFRKKEISFVSFSRSQTDLLAGLEALRYLSQVSHGLLPPAAVEVMLGDTAYGGHVTNGLDLNAVRSLTNSVTTEKLEMVRWFSLVVD